MTVLQIKGLDKVRLDGERRRVILNQLHLQINESESVAIIGDSGCGKSTLLNIIAGLETANAGEILYQQKNILKFDQKETCEYRKAELGIVFQQFNLIECLSVEENIKFTARLKRNVDNRYIERLCEILKIEHILSKPIQHISGGEQQRVAVARALAHKPRLLLADEPTGNLDSANAEQVGQLLVNCSRETNTSLVVVTHSLSIAKLTDRCLQLRSGKLHAAF